MWHGYHIDGGVATPRSVLTVHAEYIILFNPYRDKMTRQQPRQKGTVELVFSLGDERCFFVAASKRADCEFVAERAVRRTDGSMLEFFTVHGTRPEEILNIADAFPTVRDVRIVNERSDGTVMEFVIEEPCAAATLADTGAVIREATAKDGHGRIVADVSPSVDVRTVVDRFFERHNDSRLLAKRPLGDTVPGISNAAKSAHLTGKLTDKQLTAVEIATRMGYLSWPRESTATDCANEMGVSQPTFSQHLWTGLEKLLTALFETDGATSEEFTSDATV